MLARLQGRYYGEMPVECRRARHATLAFAWLGCFPFAAISLAGAVAYGYWLSVAWTGSDLWSLFLCAMTGLALSTVFVGNLRGESPGCVRPYFERSPGGPDHPALGWNLTMSMRRFDVALRELDLPALTARCFLDDGAEEPPEWYDAGDGVRAFAALVSRVKDGRLAPARDPDRTLEDLERSLALLEAAQAQGIRYCLLLQYVHGKTVYDPAAERPGALH